MSTTDTSQAMVAAVAVIVSAGTSAVVLFINAWLQRRELRLDRETRKQDAEEERNQKRKYVILEHALKRADNMWEEAQQRGTCPLPDPIIWAETYYQWLTYMWKHEQLPDDPRIERLPPVKT